MNAADTVFTHTHVNTATAIKVLINENIYFFFFCLPTFHIMNDSHCAIVEK